MKLVKPNLKPSRLRLIVNLILSLSLVKQGKSAIFPHHIPKPLYWLPCDRPMKNCSEVMVVKMHFDIYQIKELNLRKEYVELIGEIQLTWVDPHLTWNESDWSMEVMRIPMHDLWYPDITIYRQTGEQKMISEIFRECYGLVLPSGRITVGTPITIGASCAIDLTYFPLDRQVCDITLTSWAFDLNKIRLTPRQDTAGTDYAMSHSELHLIKTTAFHTTAVYDFEVIGQKLWSDITYRLIFRRRPLYYVLNFILPCMLIEIISVSVFLLPCECGEKVNLTVTLVLGVSVLLLVLLEQMPVSSRVIPLIGWYFSKVILVITTVNLSTVYVLVLHYRRENHKMPHWWKVLVFHWLAKIVFVTTPVELQEAAAEEAEANEARTIKLRRRNRVAECNQYATTKLTEDDALNAFVVVTSSGENEELRRIDSDISSVETAYDEGMVLWAKTNIDHRNENGGFSLDKKDGSLQVHLDRNNTISSRVWKKHLDVNDEVFSNKSIKGASIRSKRTLDTTNDETFSNRSIKSGTTARTRKTLDINNDDVMSNRSIKFGTPTQRKKRSKNFSPTRSRSNTVLSQYVVEPTDHSAFTWKMAALVFDRFFFVFYAVLVVTSSLCILLSALNGQNVSKPIH